MEKLENKLNDFFWDLRQNPFYKMVFNHIKDEISCKYIRVSVNCNKVNGITFFKSISELKKSESSMPMDSFNFTEVSYRDFKEFRFVKFDKGGEITFMRDQKKFENGWQIFFNTMDNIVLHDSLFPINTNHNYLKNNYLYSGVNFYVGIVALILKVKNTQKDAFSDLIQEIKDECYELKKQFPEN